MLYQATLFPATDTTTVPVGLRFFFLPSFCLFPVIMLLDLEKWRATTGGTSSESTSAVVLLPVVKRKLATGMTTSGLRSDVCERCYAQERRAFTATPAKRAQKVGCVALLRGGSNCVFFSWSHSWVTEKTFELSDFLGPLG